MTRLLSASISSSPKQTFTEGLQWILQTYANKCLSKSGFIYSVFLIFPIYLLLPHMHNGQEVHRGHPHQGIDKNPITAIAYCCHTVALHEDAAEEGAGPLLQWTLLYTGFCTDPAWPMKRNFSSEC